MDLFVLFTVKLFPCLLQYVTSPNVMAMVEFFNRIALLAASEILSQETTLGRARAISKVIQVSTISQLALVLSHYRVFVFYLFFMFSLIRFFSQIAEKCHLLGNFNSLKALLAGLQSTPVYRLKETWKEVPSKRKK